MDSLRHLWIDVLGSLVIPNDSWGRNLQGYSKGSPRIPPGVSKESPRKRWTGLLDSPRIPWEGFWILKGSPTDSLDMILQGIRIVLQWLSKDSPRVPQGFYKDCQMDLKGSLRIPWTGIWII